MNAQSTFEGCLAVCLFRLIGLEVTPKKELACLVHSLKLSKWDFVKGHLDYISKNSNIKLKRHFCKKSNEIDKILKNSPLILNIDDYMLRKVIHYPHFILIKKKVEGGYRIFDPWDGKNKFLNSKFLSRAIIELRKLKFQPQVICLR
ncbi:MAG TPA: hypothetical protein VI612_05305 [Candidatus Nanoarchaeia archaeon]|nr:hypothetical protein [Candidatus Nanoarchaeia archaeon]